MQIIIPKYSPPIKTGKLSFLYITREMWFTPRYVCRCCAWIPTAVYTKVSSSSGSTKVTAWSRTGIGKPTALIDTVSNGSSLYCRNDAMLHHASQNGQHFLRLLCQLPVAEDGRNLANMTLMQNRRTYIYKYNKKNTCVQPKIFWIRTVYGEIPGRHESRPQQPETGRRLVYLLFPSNVEGNRPQRVPPKHLPRAKFPCLGCSAVINEPHEIHIHVLKR